MTGWKLLVATPFLLAPLVVVAVSVSEGPERRAERPALVLPASVEGPQVSLRPDDKGSESTGPDAPPRPRGDQRPDRDCGDSEDHDDARDDAEAGEGEPDDDAQEGVEIVNPCPGAVGDDDGDDDDGDD